MSIGEEIWYHKIATKYYTAIPTSFTFCCKMTKIEMPFIIDVVKIREYYENTFVKWIDGDKYYRISHRNFGLGKIIWLYVDKTGEQFVIQL